MTTSGNAAESLQSRKKRTAAKRITSIHYPTIRLWPGDPEPEFDEDEEDEGVDDLPGVNKKPRQSRRTRKERRAANPCDP